MINKLLLWILIGLLTPHTLCNFAPLVGHQIWEINGGTKIVPSDLFEKGLLDILSHKKTSQEVRVKAQDIDKVKDVLNKKSISYTVLVEDLASHIQDLTMKSERARREAPEPAQVCAAKNCPRPLSDDYMSLAQMEYYLKDLAKTHKDKLTVKSIGKTHEERDIWLVHVMSNNKDVETIWINAGIHAREWIAPAVAFGVIDKLINGEIRNKAEFYIVPMVNPDGYEYSRKNDRFWRKNRRPGKICNGVDLNRNWDYKYGSVPTSNECHEDYMGTKAFSEPETKALSKAMVDVKKNIKLFIDLHSYGSQILYPYSWTREDVPTEAELIEVGNAFKEAALKSTGHHYDVMKACTGTYLASGITGDFAYGFLKVPFVYSVELRGSSFVIPEDQIKPTIQEVWDGLGSLIEEISS